MNKIYEDLLSVADKYVWDNVAGNKSKTAIMVSGGGSSKTFIEPAFSGCGMVGFDYPKSDWRNAKRLGFEKSYNGYKLGGKYYNGQFGDATRAYYKALDEFQKKFPNDTSLAKVGVYQWID